MTTKMVLYKVLGSLIDKRKLQFSGIWLQNKNNVLLNFVEDTFFNFIYKCILYAPMAN